MAPKKGGTSKELVPYDAQVEVPEEIKRDQWGRPLIDQPDGGKAFAYTRASTLGKAIEDDYNLTQWKLRTVAYGMSRRKELIAMASAVATNEDREDKAALQSIADQAITAGGGDRGANVGTALHKLSERQDAGEDLSYLDDILQRAVKAYASCMRYFEVLATETFVVCDELQAAGSFDRVVRLKRALIGTQYKHGEQVRIVVPAGTIMILDLKTGSLKSAKYWGPTYGAQQTVYAHGVPYTATGRHPWCSILGEDNMPSQQWALILHVPGDSPEDAGFVLVDLEDGRHMADLAVANREARKCKSLLTDVWVDEEDKNVTKVEVVGIVSTPNLLLDRIESASSEDELRELYADNKDTWSDEHKQAARARVAQLKAPKSEQVVRLDLMAKLRVAENNERLKALYHENKDIWTDDHLRMTHARLTELGLR